MSITDELEAVRNRGPKRCPRRTNDLAKRARAAGLNPTTVHTRIHELGWTTEKALTTPVRIGGFAARCRAAGKIESTIRYRMRTHGLSEHEAIYETRPVIRRRPKVSGAECKRIGIPISTAYDIMRAKNCDFDEAVDIFFARAEAFVPKRHGVNDSGSRVCADATKFSMLPPPGNQKPRGFIFGQLWLNWYKYRLGFAF
jgi:hypothetical protein